MIIACPACSTRYVVPDSAIGLEGRTVRCAKCKHSWFQEGPDAERMAAVEAVPIPAAVASVQPVAAPPRPAPAPAAQAASVRADTEPRPQAPPQRQPEPAAAPVVERRRDGPDFDETDPPYGDLQDDLPPPPTADVEDHVSRFEHAPPFRPRRNMARLWTWAAAIFALLAVGTMVAVNAVGLPDWVPMARPLFGAAQPDLELAFPVEEQERRTLPNGTEYFGARIIVTNTARESRDVPPIVIVLRDQRERQVYSWVVTPPQASLAPGETMAINEARTDVPKSAVFADIGWAPR